MPAAPTTFQCSEVEIRLTTHNGARHATLQFYVAGNPQVFQLVDLTGANPVVNDALQRLAQSWPVAGFSFTADANGVIQQII